jgi:CBS domain containing-hemolysin-like protein
VNGLKLTLALALVGVNAFFVVAEYALVRSRRARLEVLRDEGKGGAGIALHQLANVNEYISAVQIGITMTSIAIGALGEPALSHILEDALGDTVSHGVAVAISTIIAFTLISFAQLIGGETVPKFYAIDRAEAVARRVARPLQTFSTLFRPVIVVLTVVTDRVLRLLGVGGDADTIGGSEELKLLITESHAGGQIDADEAGMLRGVFHLHEQEARQVMTPIPAVVTVDAAADVKTALRLCVKSGHTRLVVTEEEDRDRVRGLVHVSALARKLLEAGPDASVHDLITDALIVPETKPLDDLLADLQRQRTSMAVVVDEYGRVVGVVTVEDIIEEVVGEIDDETDPTAGEIRRLANGDWLVRGHVAVADLADYDLNLPVDSDAYNSVGGFVFAELGRLPRRGDTINADGYSIRVESVRENRIEAVRIRPRRLVPRESRENGD